MGCSGGLLPPSPPSEKATACGDQTGKSGTGDRSRHRHGACGVYHDCARQVSLIHAIADDVKHFGDREGVTGSNRAQVEIVVPTAGIVVAVDSTIRANEYLL